MDAPACVQCGEPVAVDSDRAGNARYVHAEPAEDGHEAALPPVTVTYRHEGAWTDASCPELGGMLGTVTSQDAAHALAWTCLRRLHPPRFVLERHEHA